MNRTAVGIGSLGLALVCLAIIAAAPGYAAGLEQVGCFAGSEPGIQKSCKPVANKEFGEEVQLGGVTAGVGGLAVNYDGNGGVPAGTVYAALGQSPTQVAMYEPDLDGGLKFVMRWEVASVEGSYEVCGPPNAELPNGSKPGEHSACEPRPGGNQGNVDVAVDQTTGNVYVQLLTGSISAGTKVIAEYTPDADEVVTRFGEKAAGGKTVETAAQVHSVQFPGALAVDSEGTVYLGDKNGADNNYHRLMKFVPKTPGNVTEYEYAGIAQDVASGTGGSELTEPVADNSGDVYGVVTENTIQEYDPTHPAAPPICTFEFPAGAIKGMTVDPATGAAYFFAANPPRVHELTPCNTLTHRFAEAGQIEYAPRRADLWAMTFAPTLQFDPDRASGELFAAAPEGSAGGGGGEPTQSALGYIFAPTPEAPATIGATSVADVGPTSASLRGSINAHGFKTSYSFQYIPTASFYASGESFAGAPETPAGGGDAGESGTSVVVAATAVGLSPDTDFRYRLVARSKCSPGEPERVCEVVSEPLGFRTSPLGTAIPPDDRVFELVSPAQKQGGQVFPLSSRVATCSGECKPGKGVRRFPIVSSADGSKVGFEGTPFSTGQGAANENQYLATRAASGWGDANPTPGQLNGREGLEGGGYKALDRDLGAAIVEQRPPALSLDAPSEYKNLYFQSFTDPSVFRPLMEQEPQHRPPTGGEGVEFELRYAGASSDLSKVFFAANDALPTEESSFAPRAEDGGGTKFNLYEWERETGQLRLVNVLPGDTGTKAGATFGPASADAISTDGSRAFWSNEAGQVFVREDAQSTQEIPDPGKFLAASSDGSEVLLADGHLYSLITGVVTDLTGAKGGFLGVAGYASDLSDIYFVDTQVLTEEPNEQLAQAQPGHFNLYSWSEGSTHFVATLLTDDENGVLEVTGLSRDWVSIPTSRTAEASPNGRYLAFLSKAPLTGYDNEGAANAHCNAGNEGFVPGPCSEAFLYDSLTGKLSCASCNPSGARPLGWAQLPVAEGSMSLPQARFLTDTGRLFFDTGDSLSPLDTNGGAQDVYEWEPQDVGGCGIGSGCLSMISSGAGSGDSNFAAIDSSGANVFFTTRNQLVPADQDEQIDLYDAREFGGFSFEGVLAPAECQGEGCQAQATTPGEAPPASSSVVGSKGAKPVSCKKGQVKKKGKCVKKSKKKKPKKHKKATKNGKHGGAK